MKKIYCIISAFSKEPVLDIDYNKLEETASALGHELEFITISPENVNINNPVGKVLHFTNEYTHNQAMCEVIPTIPNNTDAMIVIDSNYANNYNLISNMLLELNHGANIVHVKRKSNNYWDKVFEYSFKFFNVINQMITGSNDNNYVRTLHIVDKSVLLLLKYFPNKYGIFCEADFLANCKTAILNVDTKFKLAKQKKLNIIRPLIGILSMLAGVACFVLAVTLTLGLNFIIWMLVSCITLIIGGGAYLCYSIIDYKIKSTPKNYNITKQNQEVITLVEPISETQLEETTKNVEEVAVENQVEEPTVEVVEEPAVEVVEEPKPKKTSSAKKTSTNKSSTKKHTTSKKSSNSGGSKKNTTKKTSTKK